MNRYKVSGFRSVRDKERFCLELTHDIQIKLSVRDLRLQY